MKIPVIGNIVHTIGVVVDAINEHPAIITRVHRPEGNHYVVDLTVFPATLEQPAASGQPVALTRRFLFANRDAALGHSGHKSDVVAFWPAVVPFEVERE